jgi:hypothetical protein
VEKTMTHSYLKDNITAIRAVGLGLVLPALMLSLICSGTAEAAVSDTWSKTFGGSRQDDGACVIRASDGYVVVGTTSSIGGGLSDVYLVKTDFNGNVRWSRTYGGADQDYGSVVISDGDSYVVAGSTRSFGNGSMDFFLIKVYANGTLAWNKTYGTSGYEAAIGVARVDNNYIIGGSTDKDSEEKYYLVKTDLAGNQIWAKTYGENVYDMTCYNVIGGTDGYILAYDEYYNNHLDTHLIKVDKNGAISRERVLSDLFSHQIIAVGSSYYVVGSDLDDNGMVYRLDQNLGKTWDTDIVGEQEIGAQAIAYIDGELIIAGNTIDTIPADGVDTTDLILARITVDGEFISLYRKNMTGEQRGYSIVAANDEDYVVTGFTRTGSGYDVQQDMWLIKVDSSALDSTPTPVPATSTPVPATPTPVPGSGSTATPSPSGTVPTPTESPAPTSGTGGGPTEVPTAAPTAAPTAESGSSATPLPGATESPTAGTSATPAQAGGDGGFTLGTVLIIVLLAVVVTLVGVLIVVVMTRHK